MDTLAIIPARGGSKGLPRKNVRVVAGKPLIGWTIEAAQEAATVDRIAVSTDDAEIAGVAARFGAEVIQRPAEISGDEASSEAALLHALRHLKSTEGYEPDLLAFLQCTAPLTLPVDIDGTVHALLEREADSALAVAAFHYFLWRRTPAGEMEGINHDKRRRLLRQNRAPQYVETGSVYVMRAGGFLQAEHRFFGKTVSHVVPPERRLEVDDDADMSVADVRLARQRQKERTEALPEEIGVVVFDFDGVFTDNKVLVFQDEQEAVMCDRRDGMGLSALQTTGLPLLVLSTEVNPVVRARANKLNLDIIHGVERKEDVLGAWLAERSIAWEDVVFAGNDRNDLSCVRAAGCGVAVADAAPEVKAAANVVLSRPGGHGAVRELCDLVMEFMEPVTT